MSDAAAAFVGVFFGEGLRPGEGLRRELGWKVGGDGASAPVPMAACPWLHAVQHSPSNYLAPY